MFLIYQKVPEEGAEMGMILGNKDGGKHSPDFALTTANLYLGQQL